MMVAVLAIRKAARIDSWHRLVRVERVSHSLPMGMLVPVLEEISKAARINNQQHLLARS
jgi:hypothetical protein